MSWPDFSDVPWKSRIQNTVSEQGTSLSIINQPLSCRNEGQIPRGDVPSPAHSVGDKPGLQPRPLHSGNVLDQMSTRQQPLDSTGQQHSGLCSRLWGADWPAVWDRLTILLTASPWSHGLPWLSPAGCRGPWQGFSSSSRPSSHPLLGWPSLDS